MMKIKSILASLVIVVLASGALSCDRAIYDGEGDCDILIRFEYDYNMKFADAFRNEVASVALYIFDQEGHFLRKVTDEGSRLSERNYSLRVSGFQPGVYDLVAWCGLGESPSFSVSEPATKEDLICRLSTLTRAETYIDTDMAPVFYGYVEDAKLQRQYEADLQTVVIPLCKNTNSIRILLQALNADLPILPAEYEFTITDCNASLDWRNNIVNPEPLTYYAWDKRQGTVEYEDGKRLTAAVAEFTVNRLFVRDTDKTMLRIIDKTTEKTVIHIPLTDFFVMVKGKYNHAMTDQEYLDRQDEYQITFFLDNDRDWKIAQGIFINGWQIVLSNPDLGR